MTVNPERSDNQIRLEWSPFLETVIFEPRSLPITFHLYDSSFSAVHTDIQQILETGNTGDFKALPEWQQAITRPLGVSRKLGFTHPEYPSYVFWITGIGIVTGDTKGHITVGIPDVNNTVFEYVPHMEEGWMKTWGIDPEGKETHFSQEQPVGAYWLQTAKDKYAKTNRARTILSPGYGTAIPVAAGAYDTLQSEEDAAGFFVYALPRDTIMQPFMYLLEKDTFLNELHKKQTLPEFFKALRQLPVVQSTYSAMDGLGYLNRYQEVHRQFHGGNIFYQFNADNTVKPYITDWDTLMSIKDHRKDITNSDGLSPYDHARYLELRNAVLNMGDIIPSLAPYYKIPVTVASLMGHAGIPLETDVIWDKSVETIIDIFNEMQKVPFESVIHIPNPAILKGIDEACDLYLNIWTVMSGMFPSFEQKRQSYMKQDNNQT